MIKELKGLKSSVDGLESGKMKYNCGGARMINSPGRKQHNLFLQLIVFILFFLIPLVSHAVQVEKNMDISRYGICGHRPTADVCEKFKDGMMNWVRFDFNWDFVQPTGPDQYDWEAMDTFIENLRSRGLNIFATIGYTPAWANGGHSDNSYPPVDVNQWKTFVEASVTRYQDKIKYWGIWNEPDLYKFFKGSLHQYIFDVLIPAAEAIHNVEQATGKNFFVCAPEVSGDEYYIVQTLLFAGDVVDVVTGHCYDNTSGIMGKVNSYLEVCGSKPFWLTETGWDSGEFGEYGQANRIYDLLLKIKIKPEVKKVFIYHAADGHNPNGFGLMYNDNGLKLKLAYLVFRWFVGTNDAEIINTDYPTTVYSNQSFQVCITMKNTGNLAWTREYKYSLDYIPSGFSPIIDAAGLNLSESDRVDPNQSHTFTVTVVAPDTPGFYSIGWRMQELVIGSDQSIQPFGDIDYTGFNVVAPTPAIAMHPVSHSVNVGETATFIVYATGAPPLEYRWQKDGVNVYDNGVISGSATNHLTISNCQLNHAGSYRCRVSNGYGTVYSNNAVLTVVQPQEPYSGSPVNIPGTIQAEDYDLGGEDTAYHDTTVGNICSPPQYRFEDVDIQTTSDSGGGYNVGYIAAGEWLEYTVYVTQSGYYDFDVRVAAPQDGAFHIDIDGDNVTGYRDFKATGGAQSWYTVKIPWIYLGSGRKILRFYAESSNFNLNKVTITRTTQAPYGGSVRNIPGTLQAEDYDIGGQNIAYYDTTSGNICYYKDYRFEDVDVENSPYSGSTINVGYIDNNEWLEYTVNITQAGNYRLYVRTAAPTGGAFRLEGDGLHLSGQLNIPASGLGPQDYATHTYSNIYLPRGKMVLRIEMLQAQWNLDYIQFVKQ
jgi:hypothetical protein